LRGEVRNVSPPKAYTSDVRGEVRKVSPPKRMDMWAAGQNKPDMDAQQHGMAWYGGGAGGLSSLLQEEVMQVMSDLAQERLTSREMPHMEYVLTEEQWRHRPHHTPDAGQEERCNVIAKGAIGRSRPEEGCAGLAEGLKGALKRDNQDWQLTPVEFDRWDRFYKFTVDACCDKAGRNRQVPKYWSAADSCLLHRWDGEVVWCNPPFTDKDVLVSDVLRHFRRCRDRDPSTAACFVLPYFPGAEWEKELLSQSDFDCV
jgi:hypothetical protein